MIASRERVSDREEVEADLEAAGLLVEKGLRKEWARFQICPIGKPRFGVHLVIFLYCNLQLSQRKYLRR